MVTGKTPHPWTRLTGYGISIGFHETPYFAPGPSFVATNLDARLEYLTAKGLATERGASAGGGLGAAVTLHAPNVMPIYLFDESAAKKGTLY